LGYLGNIVSTASLERPEIVIRPNAQLMAERGVTTAVVGSTVRIATSGDFDQLLPKLNLDTRQVDIRVRLADRYRTDFDTFANLRVPGRDGPVPLASIAEVSVQSGPTQIDRYDRKRYVAINADLAGYPLGDALAAARALPSMQGRPSSVQFLELGDVELMAQLFAGFGFAMVTGILCVICVLVLLFKDFLQPATILSALPLSIGGSLVALLVTGGNLDLPALIGIVMLMGIVTKNSILLVEYTFVGMREHGLAMHAALLDACHKRARPIVMTTVAMIAGMLPLALGFGGDASFRQPMAITVIGGLVTSTALSLLIVPVVFTYVLGFEGRVRRLLGRRAAGAQAPANT
jgi:multidrug efflux pump subunit AcrB